MRSKKNWSLKQQAFFLSRLSSLLDKGYTLNEALHFLYVNESKERKEDLFNSIQQLSAGNSFRQVLTFIHFHRDVLSYLYFAEKHGDLEFALRECSAMLDRKVTNTEKFMKILRYPVFLLITVGLILTIVQAVVTPQFNQLYETMNIEASFFSIFLLIVFGLLKWTGIAVGILLTVSIVYYILFFRRKPIDVKMHIIYRIPIIRKVMSMFNSYFFAMQLSTLLKGGLSTFESLRVFQSQSFIPFFKMEGDYLIEKLKTGEKLHMMIKERGYYEPELSLVILHGQANGKLARELYTYSQLLMESVDTRLAKVMAMLQPIIFGFVGIIVLFVYLSMLLPMYKMMETI
ncbi:competence type IV pilus assembly protein ComGB [Bacillus weihaiensis]|uniref:competence type IV pilus assembly protein ComGB n=1 Tax=Bacillus weihaiensis TaxID=1547283 RepID=UPI002357C52D|nr:competence type IV pilus assembly protein ComGB [Bacillus weihaiensis]